MLSVVRVSTVRWNFYFRYVCLHVSVSWFVMWNVFVTMVLAQAVCKHLLRQGGWEGSISRLKLHEFRWPQPWTCIAVCCLPGCVPVGKLPDLSEARFCEMGIVSIPHVSWCWKAWIKQIGEGQVQSLVQYGKYSGMLAVLSCYTFNRQHLGAAPKPECSRRGQASPRADPHYRPSALTVPNPRRCVILCKLLNLSGSQSPHL